MLHQPDDPKAPGQADPPMLSGEPEEIVRALRQGEIDAVVVIEPDQDKVMQLADPAIIDECHQIIQAIRSGEVDAFVVSEAGGERVLTLAAVEQALRESEARFRQLAASVPCMVWSCDASGHVDFFNDHWSAMTEAAPAGAPWLSIVDLQDHPRAEGLWRRSVSDLAPFEAELRVRDGVKDARWHKVRCVVLDGDGLQARWIGTATDIDDLKRMQEQLDRHQRHLEAMVRDRTQQLEESHQRLRLSERMSALGTLAAGLGHDMANLLMPVRMRLDALAHRNSDAVAGEDIAAIQQCTEYLQRLVSGLRTFATDPLEADGQHTDFESWWADVRPLVALALPRPDALHAEIAPSLPPLRVSRSGLTQVVYNLVQNAANALEDRRNGRITLRAHPSSQPGMIRIEVEDNGSGMSEDVRTRCLEPFFTTKKRKLSTGLGLALVHGIVEQAGGSIDIRSAVGSGTTFIITIPAAAHQEAASVEPKLPRLRACISVADARIAAYIRSTLSALSFDILTPSQHPKDHDASLWITDGHQRDVDDLAAFADGDPARLAIYVGDGEVVLPRKNLLVPGRPLDSQVVREILHAVITRLGNRPK